MGKTINVNKQTGTGPTSVEQGSTKQPVSRKIHGGNHQSTHLVDEVKIRHNAEGIDPEAMDERGD